MVELNHGSGSQVASDNQIDAVISGLKGLYAKLSKQGKKQNAKNGNPNGEINFEDGDEVDLSGWFESESDQCLRSLQDLFITRVN